MRDTALTVLIPTYNRKDGLIKTLQSLQKQRSYDYNIIISDNCSNYSIEDEVLGCLDCSFRSRISIFHQPFNVGGTSNIIGLFGLCTTEWGWLLGDDDYIQENAVEQIFSSIEEYPTIGALWYSLEEKSTTINSVIDSMDDLVSLIESINYNRNGDFIFCSNKVYNLNKIKTYMEIVHRYSYTRIAQCFPFIELLKHNIPILVVRGKPIVKHSGGSPAWDINKTVSGLSTLIDYPTGMEWKKHCKFVKLIMFSPFFVFRGYFQSNSLPWNYRSYLTNLYNCCYRHSFSGIKKIYIKTICYFGSSKIGFFLIKKYYSIRYKVN